MTMTEESNIREKAYELWEKDGRPEGAEEFYWRLAQDQLEQERQPSDSNTFEPDSGELESGSDGVPTQQAYEENEQPVDTEWPAKGEASRYDGT
jgi:hypothetical protein